MSGNIETALKALANNEIETLQYLFKIHDCAILKHILVGYTLADYQCFAIALALTRKRLILSLDTGLGKTLIAGAIMAVLKPLNKSWLFLCKLDAVRQTYKKLADALPNFTINVSDSRSINMAEFKRSEKADIYIITYEAFRDVSLNNWILERHDDFIGIFLDESHNISNNTSRVHDYAKHMLRKCFEFQFCLTATPLRTSPDQYINQVSMIDPKLIPDPKKVAMIIRKYENNVFVAYRNLDWLAKTLSPRCLSITRENVGARGKYRPIFIPIPNVHDSGYSKCPESPKVQKSDPDGKSINILVDLIKHKLAEGQKGLIYANLNKYKSLIMDKLSEFCVVAEISGRVSNTAVRTEIQQKFNNNEIDVVVINVTEALDLTCDYVVFYEQTSLYKQVIGRGERGLSGRDLEIYFMVITDNYDMNFFFRNVYQNGLLIEKLCSKDISELHAINNQIKDYLSAAQQEEVNNVIEEAIHS